MTLKKISLALTLRGVQLGVAYVIIICLNHQLKPTEEILDKFNILSWWLMNMYQHFYQTSRIVHVEFNFYYPYIDTRTVYKRKKLAIFGPCHKLDFHSPWIHGRKSECCVIPEFMMTSSNGNIFRVTGHLCGEFTGRRWIPRTKASDAELWCFLWSMPE